MVTQHTLDSLWFLPKLVGRKQDGNYTYYTGIWKWNFHITYQIWNFTTKNSNNFTELIIQVNTLHHKLRCSIKICVMQNCIELHLPINTTQRETGIIDSTHAVLEGIKYPKILSSVRTEQFLP